MQCPDKPDIAQFEAPGGLAREERLFDEAFDTEAGRTGLMFWQQSNCLVVPRRWLSLPGIEAAQDLADARGWPVMVRRSGGACVFHGPGVLCVSSIVIDQQDPGPVDRAYGEFAGGLSAALAMLGVDGVSIGPAPDAPCDGRFNLLVDGRKLAGLAMRRRMRHGRTASLVHACVWIGGPLAEAIEMINLFESRLGLPGTYRTAACITLAEAVGWTGQLDRLCQSFAAAAGRHVTRPTCSAGG